MPINMTSLPGVLLAGSMSMLLIAGHPALGAAPDAPRYCQSPKAGDFPEIRLPEIAGGLIAPVHVSNAGDGSGRLFLVEQAGTVRVYADNRLQPGVFLDITGQVRSGGEMGLLSLAFHPDFKRNGRFYVYYTSDRRGQRCAADVSLCSVIAEYSLDKRSRPGNERVLLTVAQPYGNHNGGQLAFGPDGYLYIGLGDGGSAGDPQANGQDVGSLLGAILRIDVDQQTSGSAYGIPRDNPQWPDARGRREIWAYGLRNPWRFGFDPVTGQLFAGDVGQDSREEIDLIVKAGNYGWNAVEGDICYRSGCDLEAYEKPLVVMSHDGDGWNSVTGGLVYRSHQLPQLCGVYLYADYIKGEIRGLRYDAASGKLASRSVGELRFISSFGYGEQGEIYAVNHQKGTLHAIALK